VKISDFYYVYLELLRWIAMNACSINKVQNWMYNHSFKDPSKEALYVQNISTVTFKSVSMEYVGRRCRRVNMVQILCAYLCSWKNETCWNYSRNGVRGIQENDGGVNSIWYIVRTFVNVTMYSQHNNNKK
jgi:hypothetical protein